MDQRMCIRCGAPDLDSSLEINDDGSITEVVYCLDCELWFDERTPCLPLQADDQPVEEHLRYIHD